MSRAIPIKLPHSCGTRAGLQCYEEDDGRITGFCHSCETWVADPLGKGVKAKDIKLPPPKTQEEIQAEIDEISRYQCISVSQKKLKAESLDKFGVKVGVSEVDGKTPRLLCYPYRKDGKLVGYKVKLMPLNEGDKKKIWAVGDTKGAEPFGWKEALAHGGKRIIITEGEDDAIATHQLMERYTKAEYRDYMPAIISLPRGAGNVSEVLSKYKKEITGRWNEVILAFDMDAPGREAVQKAMLILPDAMSVQLPAKDVNDCILEGVGKAAFEAIQFKAEKPKNSRLVFGEELHESAKEQASFGELSWPFPDLNKTTRGIRLGETIYVGAGVKMGKSELLNEIAAHFIQHHGVKVFMAKPEESNKKTYKLLAGKIAKQRFHDPEVEFDAEAYDKAGEVLHNKLAMVNLYQHLGWDSLRDDIIAAAHWGAKAVFIDPITNLTNGVNAADANTELQKVAQDLAAMALDLNIVVFIFCHLKAPDGEISKEKREKLYRDGQYMGLGVCPHERGGDVTSAQFAGSRAMMRSCNMMLGLEGNKDDALSEEIKHLRDLVLIEDREFGEVGRFHLSWNKNTTRFVELGHGRE